MEFDAPQETRNGTALADPKEIKSTTNEKSANGNGDHNGTYNADSIKVLERHGGCPQTARDVHRLDGRDGLHHLVMKSWTTPWMKRSLATRRTSM